MELLLARIGALEAEVETCKAAHAGAEGDIDEVRRELAEVRAELAEAEERAFQAALRALREAVMAVGAEVLESLMRAGG